MDALDSSLPPLWYSGSELLLSCPAQIHYCAHTLGMKAWASLMKPACKIVKVKIYHMEYARHSDVESCSEYMYFAHSWFMF